ncbi:MAG: polysaccharide biosynthesis protein [Lachnospiraceae bacterium]|jgi:FlaA1/EpsC-like NDP-sugar epimerase|nr:polysaccharide biosynthesis protein [Lachnospiraceae bacterium]
MNLESFVEKNAPRNRVALLAILDILIITISGFLSLYIRFDFSFSKMEMKYVDFELYYLPVNLTITIVIFILFRLYRSVWRFASTTEFLNVIGACSGSILSQIVIMAVLKMRMPVSYYLMKYMILILGVGSLRFAYRIMRMFSEKRAGIRQDARKNTMVIGAGEAGAMIIKEFQNSRYLDQKVCCVIDDNQAKQGKYLRGVKIMGGREDIRFLAHELQIDEIVVALPSASRSEVKEILQLCQETGCELKVLPGLYQVITGEVSISTLRKVEIEDLLGREPIKLQVESVMDYVAGKRILVTGGGGSIGSELCRQLAAHNPKQLIIVDIYENNAYDIQQELKKTYPALDLVVLIASVRNTHRMNSIFETYRPEIVYHAAAHKHVPLMEDSPNEAIKNNVFGTYKTAQAAARYGVRRFVLISTDKAVNPTNVMGASKRICEMVIQMMNKHAETDFVAVRFGNVLGSNGSVIPLFKKQIEQGGPVTVTHPEIIRYFMTIPEAVSLVLQAGALAKGGEIFVLDMGEPVKILDLAKNLIRLSGYKPFEDIPIEFTGLRPGEKLYEELLMGEEGLKETSNALIHIGKPIEFDEEIFLEQLEELKRIADKDSKKVRQKVQEIVPTYVIKSDSSAGG